jgi:hypothetical protein
MSGLIPSAEALGYGLDHHAHTIRRHSRATLGIAVALRAELFAKAREASAGCPKWGSPNHLGSGIPKSYPWAIAAPSFWRVGFGHE